MIFHINTRSSPQNKILAIENSEPTQDLAQTHPTVRAPSTPPPSLTWLQAPAFLLLLALVLGPTRGENQFHISSSSAPSKNAKPKNSYRLLVEREREIGRETYKDFSSPLLSSLYLIYVRFLAAIKPVCGEEVAVAAFLI